MSFIYPPRGASGLFGGRGAYTVTTPAPATVFTTLMDADATLQTALSAAIAHVAGLGLAAKDAPVPAAVIAASPGAGKSRVARELLSTVAGAAPVLFHAPTLALCDEAAAHARELGGMAHVIRGRLAPDPTDPSQQMCRKSALVARGLRLGLNIRETFCFNDEARCEHADSCAWMRQFDPEHAVGHRYLATSYLGYPDPDGYEGVLRVVDETFWAGQVSFASVDIEEFCLPRTFLQHYTRRGRRDDGRVTAHADLIAAARAVVDALRAGRSPLELPYTEEEYRGFARLEYAAQAHTPAPTPDLPQDQQALLLAQAETALRHASRYAAVWTCLAQAKAAGRKTLERVRLVTLDGRSALKVCRKHATEHRQPLLVLDADADPEILRALEIDVQRRAHMVLRPVAEVLQVHDRRMTHTSLLRGERLREDWRRIIRREVLRDREGQGGGVLVGASRKVVRRFFEDAGYSFDGLPDAEVSRRMLEMPLHGARWLWFGGRSLGTNLYRDASTVIVIGREELPVDALEDYGRALWGDRADADLRFIEPDKEGVRRLPDQELLYEMTDGRAVGVLVPCHPDPLIRRVQMQTRELATRQLVERLRLARSATRKRVILGCNMPIPGLPVDALVAWDELCLDRPQAALVDALLEKGGIRLSDAGLVKDAPRIFPTLDAVKAFRKRGSIDVVDMIEAPPIALRGRLHVVQLQQDRPYARRCLAVVLAGSAEDACRQAELIWGPMRSCSVAPQVMQIRSGLEPRSGT